MCLYMYMCICVCGCVLVCFVLIYFIIVYHSFLVLAVGWVIIMLSTQGALQLFNCDRSHLSEPLKLFDIKTCLVVILINTFTNKNTSKHLCFITSCQVLFFFKKNAIKLKEIRREEDSYHFWASGKNFIVTFFVL